uniref:Uncharacterized protein n=1 Tax=Solanum tuberosum TaxID=4113 RepID=M1BN22_SOLTU
MQYLVDCVGFPEWEHLFKWPVPFLHEAEVHKFYYHMEIHEYGSIDTRFHDMEIHSSEDILRVILEVPFPRDILGVILEVPFLYQ